MPRLAPTTQLCISDELPIGQVPAPQTPSRSDLQTRLTRHFRRHVASQCHDNSGSEIGDVAIYFLADPRDAQEVRYIGQTTSPTRRLLQHLNTARLWMPDEAPWWVKSPKYRPLSTWIRELYRDEYRLPVMMVTSWVALKHGRLAERARIMECLAQGRALLNVEYEILGRQLSLI